MSLSDTEARALARQLNWEPPDHDDYPGSIPESAWDHWRAFEFLAAQTIAWRKVDPAAWREAHGADWSPAFEAESDGRRLLIIQHDWHGFPSPGVGASRRRRRAGSGDLPRMLRYLASGVVRPGGLSASIAGNDTPENSLWNWRQGASAPQAAQSPFDYLPFSWRGGAN